MATFSSEYSEAYPNTPILSSSWNQNNEASKERFQKHDHTGVGESGPKVGRAGLDDTVNNLLDQVSQISALETTLASIQGQIGGLQGLLVQPTVTQITDASDNPISNANRGDTVKIHGSNFNSPLTVRFKSVVVPEDQVTVAPGHNSITVTIPNNVEAGSQFISVSVGASAISGLFIVS